MSDSKSSGRFWLLIFVVLLVFGGLFVLGYLPRHKQEKVRDAEAQQVTDATPTVTVAKAKAAPDTTTVTLPADTKSLRETFVFAQANGFVKSWSADIGQKVRRKNDRLPVICAKCRDQSQHGIATSGVEPRV